MKKKGMKKKASGQTRKKKEIRAEKKRDSALRADPEMILWDQKIPKKKVPLKHPPNPIFRPLRALFSSFRALRGPIFHFFGPCGAYFPFFGPCGAFCPIFRALRGLLPHFFGPCGASGPFFRALRGLGHGPGPPERTCTSWPSWPQIQKKKGKP